VGLGTLQQSTLVSTPSTAVNTTVRVFDPSGESSLISVESVERPNYTIEAASVNTTEASPVSRFYDAGSYAEVYALPLEIRLSGSKSSYRVPVNIRSRPVSRSNGVTPVVSRRIRFEIDYTGQKPDSATRPRLEFGGGNASEDESLRQPNLSSNAENDRDQFNDSQALDSTTDTDSGSRGPNPVLLLFIVATAGYILWRI
jgi:hypothetical protein